MRIQERYWDKELKESLANTLRDIFDSTIPDFVYTEEDDKEFYKVIGKIKIVKEDSSPVIMAFVMEDCKTKERETFKFRYTAKDGWLHERCTLKDFEIFGKA